MKRTWDLPPAGALFFANITSYCILLHLIMLITCNNWSGLPRALTSSKLKRRHFGEAAHGSGETAGSGHCRST